MFGWFSLTYFIKHINICFSAVTIFSCALYGTHRVFSLKLNDFDVVFCPLGLLLLLFFNLKFLITVVVFQTNINLGNLGSRPCLFSTFFIYRNSSFFSNIFRLSSVREMKNIFSAKKKNYFQLHYGLCKKKNV